MANATHKPNDPKGEAGSKKTPLGLIPPSAMEEIAWVHKLGANKYGRTVPVFACSAEEQLAEFCTCGHSTQNPYVTQTDPTLLKGFALSATLPSTHEVSQQHVTKGESRGGGGCASPVTTECFEKRTPITDNANSKRPSDGCLLTKSMSKSSGQNTTDCQKQDAGLTYPTELELLLRLASHLTMRSESSTHRITSAQSAKDQQVGADCLTSTTTTKPESLGGLSATGATKDLACSETISRLLNEHSRTCETRRLIVRDGYVEQEGSFNWRRTGVCASTYVHAILRHLNAWRDGEDLDPESGRSHIAHVACCCNILLDAAACGTLDDDRNKRPQTVHETIESTNTRCKVCSKPAMYHYIYGWCCEECDFTDPYFEP